MYAQVVLQTQHPDFDKIFDYKIPAHLENVIRCGMRVIVPFGYNNAKSEGYIINISDVSDFDSSKIKEIIKPLDNFVIFEPDMLELAKWMKIKYFTTLTQCLQTMMPAGIKTKSQWFIILSDNEFDYNSLSKKEKTIIDILKENNNIISRAELDLKINNVYPTLKILKDKKIIYLRQKTDTKDFTKKVKYIKINYNCNNFYNEYNKICSSKRFEMQKYVIDLLDERKILSVKELKDVTKVSDYTIRTLIKKNLVTEEYIEEKRNLFDLKNYELKKPFIPTYEQKIAIDIIEKEMNKENKKPILIHGVTGSGKTEIYIRVIESIVSKGGQAIVLVPEISLTPQIVERFVSRLGNSVSVTHSRLSKAERYDQWKKAKNNEISVMIGPRSALFTPFSNLKAIIIDEEHDTSYYSDVTPKYSAVEVAQKLCSIKNSLLIMGSATPDLKMYYRAKKNEVILIKLLKRTNNNPLPTVYIEDMRSELANGNRSIFSQKLYEAIKKNIEDKEQTMLFINRRGFSTFVSCRKCGYVMMCDNCNVSYTYHSYNDNLICHYCGKKIKNPKTCPVCGSKYIKYFGIGTQKVEEEVKTLFPNSKVLRMDLDTTTKKNSHQQILESFRKGEADILIGTQMIAKGHDFPNVTLVGIIAADLSLNSGSYMSTETTFQLITQVAGRAGRHEKEGRVFIQTYNPDNYCINLAAKQDYESFYLEEIEFRRSMEYPPFSTIFAIILSNTNENETILKARQFFEVLINFNKNNEFLILGPTPAAISKIKNEYRWRIIVKHKDEEHLKNYILYCISKFKEFDKSNIYINLIMNPFGIV